ncbi:p53 and DNA damage-regulated protein 1 [Euwallacea fornicatus]|uniref:p53 and DNA damage-regulated protein 1 n=1 Tax=Euwallacea fornicatus TaxID=995702 RepID=UPI00339021EB
MTQSPSIEQQKSFTYLREVETVAQELLSLKHNKLEIANAQNKYREGLRALEHICDRTTWIQIGSVYIEQSTEECKAILRKEIAKTEEDLSDLHKQIKENVHKLRDLEHEPRLEGFALKPISVAEAKALHKGFGSA